MAGYYANPNIDPFTQAILEDEQAQLEKEMELKNDYARGGVGPVSQPVYMDRPTQSSWFGIDKLQEPKREVAQVQQGMPPEAMQLFQVGTDRPTALGSGTMRKLREKELESQKLQQEGIASLQKRLEALSKKPEQKGGLQKAIAMAADMWGGGGGAFTKAYDEANPQMTEGQRQAAITQLEDTLRKAKGDLTQSDIDLLKLQLGHEYDLAKLKEKQGGAPDIKEWQFRAGEFASRAGGGDQALDELFKSGYTPSTIGGWIPFDSWKPEDRKAYDNYAQTFVNSVLRRESGASISDPEAQKALAQYIPVPGDSPQRIEEKSLLRKQAVANMGITAGPAMQLMQGLNMRGATQAGGQGGSPWKKYGGQ